MIARFKIVETILLLLSIGWGFYGFVYDVRVSQFLSIYLMLMLIFGILVDIHNAVVKK